MELAQFDRDITLAELLRAISGVKLGAALDRSLGSSWALHDSAGGLLLGTAEHLTPEQNIQGVALRVELESIGKLSAAGAPESIASAAAWLELVLAANYRYSMASDLHLEAVAINYHQLQQEHQALQESEQRYRELAAQLEQRVAEQVVLIERSQRQLYQAEKMASVGSLAAGVAHEINNPIGFIRSNLSTAIGNVEVMRAALEAFHSGATQMAQEIWKANDLSFVLTDFPMLLAESVDGADRVARIVANLKEFSNIDHSDTSQVDLNDAVRNVMDLVRDQTCPEVELVVDFQRLPLIVCDRGRFNQVLLSLVQNGLQALRGKGRLRVASMVDGNQIKIAVSDNGCGIAPQALARIFDPFYTSHDVGSGTGLGLTVSQEIVASYGGRIEVESIVGLGSTFTVCLPLPDSAHV